MSVPPEPPTDGDEVPPRQLYGDLPESMPGPDAVRLQILAARERSAAKERRREAKRQAAIERHAAHNGGKRPSVCAIK
jgi:hypothetical protein